MEQIKINGIRLNRNYSQVTDKDMDLTDKRHIPLYQSLSSKEINMVSMTLNTKGNRSFVTGTIASKDFSQIAHKDKSWVYHPRVCTLSIYPHNYRLQVLGFLISLLGKHKLSFQHLGSSTAMLTFVVDEADCPHFIDILSKNFTLPESHAPFEQEENDELAQFLKKKYNETRATYVEKKIKTYGITISTDLNFSSYLFSFDQLTEYGQKMQSSEDKFSYASAYMETPTQARVFLLTQKSLGITAEEPSKAEFISCYGPHFGDRHTIISRALNCLSDKSIPVLHAGCTGAGIGIIVPQGQGKDTREALRDVFDIP